MNDNLFPPKSKKEDEIDQKPEIELNIHPDVFQGELDPAIVAAISVAICSLQIPGKNSLGKNLETGRGRWWSVHGVVSHQVHGVKKS